MHKPVIGVMGASANDALTVVEMERVKALADQLGAAIARADCFLVTGATTGLPAIVATSFRQHGGFALGISPAENRQEHVARYGLPEDGADVIVYTSFGYKGRNVINVRSSDIVLFLGGATGTLNEFTIAYDEGKIVGVLEGSGGITDHFREILRFCNKPMTVQFDRQPVTLIEACLAALEARQS